MHQLYDTAPKQSCAHKSHKRPSTSGRNKTVTSSDHRFTSKVYTSPSKIPKVIPQDLIAEN